MVNNLVGLVLVFSVFSASSADIAQNLCEYVNLDDKKRIRSFLKTNKLKIRSVFDGVQCNGKNLLEFADAQGSEKVGTLIISKLPKKVVAKASLTNETLQLAASDRIN